MASASALPPNATDARWAIAAALLPALFLFAANPVGFVGGGQDDYRYLLAARCVAEHGACLPLDHWARRWPLVLRPRSPCGWAGRASAR